MEFSLSLDPCGNSSCMRCELDLYIHPSNYRGHGRFLSEWFGTDGAVGGVVVFSPLLLDQLFHRDFIG